MEFPKNEGYSVSRRGAVRRKESGTPFDATVMDDFAAVGKHELADDGRLDKTAFTTLGRRVGKPSTSGAWEGGDGEGARGRRGRGGAAGTRARRAGHGR